MSYYYYYEFSTKNVQVHKVAILLRHNMSLSLIFIAAGIPCLNLSLQTGE